MTAGNPGHSFVLHDGVGFAQTPGAVVVLQAEPGAAMVVPHGALLLVANFVRQGADLLLVGPDGIQILIKGYFALDHPPALMTEGGEMLAPDLVARLAEPLAPGPDLLASCITPYEPELTLFATSSGKIVGYTVGNDVSSRSIEGENPLYLPQAKTYDDCACLGPCLLVPEGPLPPEKAVNLEILREDEVVFSGETSLSQMKRKPEELIGYLFRETTFPSGVFLMTGTGIVPGQDFTLQSGDEVSISIYGIGTLTNSVA